MSLDLSRYGRLALVTGASSGIGLEFARVLAAAGFDLLLVARGRERLEARAQELSRSHGIEATPITLDLTAEGAVDALHRQLAGRDVGLVVLNAGVEAVGPFAHTPLEQQAALQRLNVDVPTRMASLFGASMADRGRGAIVFVSSLFAYQGVPYVAHYAASKAYVLALGEALHVELKPAGVDVLVVSPGLTDTAMPARMPLDFAKVPMPRSSPQRVAAAALRALGRQATIVPGLINKVYAWQNRLLPRSWPVRLFGLLVWNAMDRSLRQPAAVRATNRLEPTPRA
jgi:short-subunit dehydrogenase